MRARYPDRDGYVVRDGVKVFFEVYGDGDPTILLLPTWSIIHSRRWKMQIPYLARHFRVLTFDGRGNGRSDRPRDPVAYADSEFVADALAVMDETGTERAVLAGVSMGGGYALRMAAEHPDRVQGAVFVCPAVGLADPLPARRVFDFEANLDTEEGWAKQNIHYWRRDWPGYAEFFFEQVFSEPHSTKQIEDCAGWATETDADTILTLEAGPYLRSSAAHRHEGTAGETTRLLATEVRCPCLVVHGTEDRIVHVSGGKRLAEALGCRFVAFEGSGHCPDARDPVRFNLLMEEFVRDVARPAMAPPAPARATWTRARNRPRRVLYLSSPIGLGHARRDLAIARELRALRPDLEVEWLAQDPVTRVLGLAGERVHPASAWLAGESAHVESEAGEHDLHAFQAIRRMDEILLANYMVAYEAMEDGAFDVVIGDEAWDVDHFLHENPEGKRASFVWMTDFVGWLPMPEGGEREEFLTADYNAEMIEHIERYPRVRDRAIFVGNPEDIVNDAFGPGLPPIRAWTEEHYDFAGYVTGFDPAGLDPGAVREELGYRPDERVCVVTVGGSGVGEHLLRKVIAAYPEAKRLVPDLRMVVVAGPRIDPDSLPSHDGLDVRAFVPELYRHLAVCDLAVIQGGLTTAMELVAARRPFVYFPLANHFEQQIHVRHRLERHRAGRPMDYRTSSPEAIADAMAAEIVKEPDYLPVETDGAARAAAAIAELL